MKSIIIFGRNIKIIKVKGLLKEQNIFGYYDPEKFSIYIDKELSKKDYQTTLLHEMGHALFHRAGLSQSKLGRDLEEIIVEQYSQMISENIKQIKF